MDEHVHSIADCASFYIACDGDEFLLISEKHGLIATIPEPHAAAEAFRKIATTLGVAMEEAFCRVISTLNSLQKTLEKAWSEHPELTLEHY